MRPGAGSLVVHARELPMLSYSINGCCLELVLVILVYTVEGASSLIFLKKSSGNAALYHSLTDLSLFYNYESFKNLILINISL